MEVKVNDECLGCIEVCQPECHVDAIMEENGEENGRAVIDQEQCDQCDGIGGPKCIPVCPIEAIYEE